MEPLLERLADRLASRSTRRQFFRLAAKVTAAAAAAGVGFTRFYNDIAAYTERCCDLEFAHCPCDPLICGCPSQAIFYWSWNCCYVTNGCYYTCQECYYSDQPRTGCSYSQPTGESCGGDCPFAPAP